MDKEMKCPNAINGKIICNLKMYSLLVKSSYTWECTLQDGSELFTSSHTAIIFIDALSAP